MIELLILNDSAIQGLLQNQQVLAAFPQLTTLRGSAPATPACGRCRRTAQSAAAVLAPVKTFLAHLAPASQAQLKQLLGAKAIKLHWRNPQGQLKETRW